MVSEVYRSGISPLILKSVGGMKNMHGMHDKVQNILVKLEP